MKPLRILSALFACFAALALGTLPTAASDTPSSGDDTFTPDEVVQAGSDFFGTTTEVMAKAVQRVTEDLGLPDGYIKGDEGSGAFILGLRYGSGWLIRKNQEPVRVYWRGPSVGFDVGGNGSKVFTLVYNLKEERRLYQRFPGVEGSIYFIAGIGVNYLRSGGVTLAPMRTGIGWRAGVNAHYQIYSDHRDWFPL
ncbi:MAG: EipA family protein [Rhizomicrobium sp.]